MQTNLFSRFLVFLPYYGRGAKIMGFLQIAYHILSKLNKIGVANLCTQNNNLWTHFFLLCESTKLLKYIS
jgi:hypothetical protein